MSPCGAAASVRVLRLDPTWLTPDAEYDKASNGIHVVYGTGDKDAFYFFYDIALNRSTAPHQLNPVGGLKVTTTMGERGPKITVTPKGRIVVVWADLWTGPGCRV